MIIGLILLYFFAMAAGKCMDDDGDDNVSLGLTIICWIIIIIMLSVEGI